MNTISTARTADADLLDMLGQFIAATGDTYPAADGTMKPYVVAERDVHKGSGRLVGAEYDVDKDVMVSWLPCFHDMGMVGFLTIPMYFGAELVKVTPMDFLRDTLLWAKLIDKYKGTMTAAPNFAYALFAKRLRRQAKPGEFDLSTLRFALSMRTALT